MALERLATITGTISAYAGGSVTARFQKQGGGKPTVGRAVANIGVGGVFSFASWDNLSATYAPSLTIITINLRQTSCTVVLPITGTYDVSTAFSGAPTPD